MSVRAQLDAITVSFVEDRRDALERDWEGRNQRMDIYEDLYTLDLWKDEAAPDERRIATGTAFNEVEMGRTLLLTRRPVITVPPSDLHSVAEAEAERMERYLYGVWRQANVMWSLLRAEWAASCLGEGVLRVVYDPEAVEGDCPIVVQALDPRNVYGTPSGRPFRDLEVLHTLKRSRREIESEWGIELAESDEERSEAWLDDEVDFIDYWREIVVEEEAEAEAEEPEEEQPLGVLARVVQGARRMLGRAEEAPEAPEEGEEPVETGPRMVRRRRVVNCVVADGQWVKEPVVVPGYESLPIIRYPGILTGMAGKNEALSVLYPMTAGGKVTSDDVLGVLAAEAEAVSMRHQLVGKYATGSWVTDDDQIESLDMRPDAINHVAPGRTVQPLVPPGVPPAVDGHVQLMQRYVQDVGTPEAMKGRYQGDVSGIALTAMTNPVLMRVASRQMIREMAYQRINELMLSLAEEYAVAPKFPTGWYVYGEDRRGTTFEERIEPDDIDGYRRNRVKLSASLPKDESGQLMAAAQFVQQKLLSRRAWVDLYQQTQGGVVQSPSDEMQRILTEQMLYESDVAKQLAQALVEDYAPGLLQSLAPEPAPQQAQPGPLSPGPAVVPPQAMPEAVGAGGLQAMARMMAMQGQPPVGEPGGPGQMPPRPPRPGGER